ncbi:MAG: hypothetical protein KBD62_35940 [Kofleriaceae bacterium]|nr:hypothetical protein [Kofleriaceae bacterium]
MATTVLTARDTYCLDALVPGRWATGLTLLAQRLYHRLTTPAGVLGICGGEEEADFGIDLAAYVGATEDAQLAYALPVTVRNELIKDVAVDSVTCTATRTVSGGSVSWVLSIHVVATVGELDMLVSVSDVTVELLRVT